MIKHKKEYKMKHLLTAWFMQATDHADAFPFASFPDRVFKPSASNKHLLC